jgi:hypothetical protein
MSTVWVDPRKLGQGSIRHAHLAPGLVERIRAFAPILADVFPRSLDAYIDGFLRDGNPEREVEIFEHIAAAYVRLPHDWPLEKRREAFGLMILLTMTDARDALANMDRKHLTLAEAETVAGLSHQL